MSKPISRKHILVSGVAMACLSAVAPTWADTKVGVTSAVNPQAVGHPPSAQERTLFVGVDMQAEERVRTTDKGQVQLLFLDGSALSIGPNSDLSIDKFVYDPEKKVGELGFSAARGVFRLVGGKISKNSEVEFKTPTATIGIRGGIALVRIHDDGRVSSTFLFGDRMRVTSGGATTSTTRPSTIEAPPSGPPSAPRPVAQGDLRTALPLLEGSAAPVGGGSDEPGEDQRLAAGGLGRSADETPAEATEGRGVGRDRMADDMPTREVPDVVAPGSSIGRTFVGRVNRDPWGAGFDPVTLHVTRDPLDSAAATAVESGAGRLTVQLNGESIVLPYRIGEQFDFSRIDTNLEEPIFGYGDVNKHSFSYLIFPGTGIGPVATHVYGGDQTAAARLPTSGVAAYFPHKDYFDQTPSPYETNPPVYVRWLPAGPSPILHASLEIGGHGPGQTSQFFGVVGAFFHEQGSDMPAVGGFAMEIEREHTSYELDGEISGVASAPLGTGSAVYGPSGEEVLVIPDLMEYTIDGYVRHPANGLLTWGGNEYPTWFAEPLVRGEAPAHVGGPVTANTFQGYSAGAFEVSYIDPINGPMVEYIRFATTDGSVLNGMGPGGLVVSTDPTSHSVSATASLKAIDGTIDGNVWVVEFGGHGASDVDRSTMIDDNVFGARESASRPVDIEGASAASSRLFMVTNQTVSNDGWTQPGVSLCECSYLKWGWWMGTAHDETSGKEAAAHLATWVAGHLWGVNVPMVGTATYGGHVIGNVYKEVNGVGNSYVAAGSFRNDWNFGTRQGAVAIDNFDGMNFSGGAISTNGRDFSGSFTQNGATPAVAGELAGSFFVNPAAAAGTMPAHMAGQFVMQNVANQPAYAAAGTFAAQR